MLIIKKTYKVMHTLLWCIYYDLLGKNISLKGRHLVLTQNVRAKSGDS